MPFTGTNGKTIGQPLTSPVEHKTSVVIAAFSPTAPAWSPPASDRAGGRSERQVTHPPEHHRVVVGRRSAPTARA